MKKSSKHIEIVRSEIFAFSQMGQKSCDMIYRTLAKHYEHVGITQINTQADLEKLVRMQPDLVFLGMKTMPRDIRLDTAATEKVWLSAYLSEHGINYTGSTQPAMMLDFDKFQAKQLVKKFGLKTASFFTASVGEYQSAAELPLPFPVFVKPPNEGGGKGIDGDSVVRDFAGFEKKVQTIWDKFHTSALVETYLSGREFSVALLQANDRQELLAMPVELLTPQNARGDSILGGQIKSDDSERVVAVEQGLIRDEIIKLATDVFSALGARDYGRVDIRMDQAGVPHFLEANLVPGLAEHDFTSYFTSACLINCDMDYEAMILRIAALGMARSTHEVYPLSELVPFKQLL